MCVLSRECDVCELCGVGSEGVQKVKCGSLRRYMVYIEEGVPLCEKLSDVAEVQSLLCY